MDNIKTESNINSNQMNDLISIKMKNENIPKKSLKNKIKEFTFPILSVVIAVSGSFMKHFILKDYQPTKNDKTAYYIMGWFQLFMILISYYKTISADHIQTFLEEKLNNNPNLIYNKKDFIKKCEFCNRLKFERSSHCTICKCCISRRDHHCVWINKCVGFSNTQYFVNYCIWLLIAGIHYFSGFITYYNYQEDDFNLIISFAVKILFYIISLIMMIGTVGITSILIQQINAIYNEVSSNELRKKPHFETYYLCCVPLNLDKKESLGYNKGFLNNFINIIGPSFFHLIFPFDKFSSKDLQESEKVFKKMKVPSSLEVRKIISNSNPKWSDELKLQDKNNEDPIRFIEYSKISCQNYLII